MTEIAPGKVEGSSRKDRKVALDPSVAALITGMRKGKSLSLCVHTSLHWFVMWDSAAQ